MLWIFYKLCVSFQSRMHCSQEVRQVQYSYQSSAVSVCFSLLVTIDSHSNSMSIGSIYGEQIVFWLPRPSLKEFLLLITKCVSLTKHWSFNSVHYVKNPGAVLEPGSVVAKLELDDPSKVTQVKKHYYCSDKNWLFSSIMHGLYYYIFEQNSKNKSCSNLGRLV